MVTTPSKRSALSPPGSLRPSKRQATSSPEEGEVDDGMSYPKRASPLPGSPPPDPEDNKYESRVKFPFKKKATLDTNGAGSSKEVELKDGPVVYERSMEDEKRFQELENHRKDKGSKNRPGSQGNKSRGHNTVDHWEPSYPNDDRERSRWRDSYEDDRYYAPDYDYDRRGKSRRGDHDSRGDYHRERRRTSPTPPSGDRSRSPSTPRSSHRQKHRLPGYRTPNFSPPSREYHLDRRRDHDRYYPDYDRQDRQHSWQNPGYGDDARHWKPSRSPSAQPYHADEYSRRSDDWRTRADGDSPERHGVDRHRPRSPSPPSRRLPPRPPLLESPPKSSHLARSRTPPPPVEPPPPPPPEFAKNEALPLRHTAISISMPYKKPPAPKDEHSPSPLPLPPPPETSAKDQKPLEELKEEKREEQLQGRKREPLLRSRKEEMEAYGRTFLGCGIQSDYEVTTKLGEGTFGEVHKAIQKATGRAVALKRILMHNEKEGMPVTALREIKILKALKHSCIIEILDMFVVRSKGRDSPLSVYMVFPYMDHDLAGLLENERVKLQPSHIKLYMKQLLEGTEYMHRNHILHRDMKAANLLISNSGSLRIADFGLARTFDPKIVLGGQHVNDHRGKERKYTNCVVTRWYRPPELLLGARQYGGEIDIWGIGCVLGEMFSRKPILPGNSDLDQLDKIWQLCGSPNQHNWPNYDELPGCDGVRRFTNYPRRIKQVYESVGPETCDLLDRLLTCNPRTRITASDALDHDYFWTDPLPADPKTLPSYEASHEFDRRGRHRPPPGHAGPPPPVVDQYRPPMVQLPGYYARGPPPPREIFRNGPPPHAVPPPGPPPVMPPGQGPPPPYGVPYPQYSQMPQMHPYGPPPAMPYGMQGRPPMGMYQQPPVPVQDQRWNPVKDRPSHLPPRPPGPPPPLGRGGGHNRGNRYPNGPSHVGGLNYG